MRQFANILKTRICDLELSIENSWVKSPVAQLFRELDRVGLGQLQPKIYFGDEWYSPDQTVAISVPFYLANQRLMNLERMIMKEVEGGTRKDCMRLLRHEAGHCFDHAFGLSERRIFRSLFGDPRQPYRPDFVKPIPRDGFVRHLSEAYAQTHPLEDFAETFAVWLSPYSQWRRRYANQPIVLQKFAFIEEMVDRYANRKPLLRNRRPLSPHSRLRRRLGDYYSQRKKVHQI